MAVNPSKVRLESITLQDFRLENNPAFSGEGGVVNFVGLVDHSVEKVENLRYITTCRLTVNTEKTDTPFKISAVCKVVASVESVEHLDILSEFATVGAVFNAIVFFRELVREVTSRTSFGPVSFPLLDITSFRLNPAE